MDGFFLLNKEKGITSNQLVQNIKKSLKFKKVGHLGTLDPMATGLMVIAANRATKFSSYFFYRGLPDTYGCNNVATAEA